MECGEEQVAGWTGLPPQDGQELPRPGQPAHQAVHGVAGHPAESDPDLRGWVLIWGER